MKRIIFLATTPLLFLCACGLDELEPSGDDTLRAVVIADQWAIDTELILPEYPSCEAYWDHQCAELEPAQCVVAQGRYSCSESEAGVTLEDTYGALIEDTRWTAFSKGDKAPIATKGEVSELCEELGGLDYERCLGLARAAELIGELGPEILGAFPNGGFATLAVHDDMFVIEPGAPAGEGGDFVSTTAAALDWRAPEVEGEFVIGPANGATVEPGVGVTVRPNGLVAIATDAVVFQPEPRPLQQPPTNFLFDYSMSAPGANYNQQNVGVVYGWGRYAALWKSFHDPAVTSVNVAACYAGPNHDVLLGAEQPLNTHEAAYFTNQWGQYDPVGIWMSIDIDDPLTGIAYAAMAMHYWHTPVFFSGFWQPPTNLAPVGAWYGDFALEQLNFQHPSQSSLHALCGISPSASAAVALANVQSCNLSGLGLTGAVVTAWEGRNFSVPAAPGLLHHQVIGGGDLLNVYAAGYMWDPWFASGRVGELIFDPPPEANEEEIAAVLALAEVLAEHLHEQVELEQFAQ